MSKTNVTIKEDYILPSRGKMYNKPIDPNVELRSMTVAEEMKRLSRTENPYKMMSEIIDDCLITKLPISTYDLCLCDYIYLLHKMRVVTYGTEYTIQYICPVCGKLQKTTIDLDNLNVLYYDESIENDKYLTLPSSKREVKLRFQTPRDLDKIEQRKKELKSKLPEGEDPTILLTLSSLIETIDGKPLDAILGLEALKKLPMMDMNYLAQKATKLQEKVGIDTIINAHCSECGNDVKTTFRYTSEFFRPTVD
jgi:hypothetical protein